MSNSTRKFTPGNSSNSSRMIHYVAEFNARYPGAESLNCLCITD